MPPTECAALVVRKSPQGSVSAAVERVSLQEPPPGEVTIRVRYSSLNYKDALALEGHEGVVKQFPHVPGIDAAGTVADSGHPRFQTGQEVLVTGYELGSTRWGGYCEYIRVPADWVVPLTARLSMFEAMLYGTAGLTAALCVRAIRRQEIEPARGPVVVTGASGGVGCLAVALLARLGYRVSAVTGKPAAHELLQELGAAEILDRGQVHDTGDRALLAARWAAAVDTVGGQTLATLVRSTQPEGCVAACGLVGGAELPLTVYPFILRGVTLCGIDSVQTPPAVRLELWDRLAGAWRPDKLSLPAREIDLAEVIPQAALIRRGELTGRTVVRVAK